MGSEEWNKDASTGSSTDRQHHAGGTNHNHYKEAFRHDSEKLHSSTEIETDFPDTSYASRS
jgi:hypothetical protein